MKRFGIQKFVPRPKTEADWTRLYNRHKCEVPKIKKLTLTLSSKGPGQTGARHFKAYAIPPLKRWNPNLEISVNLDSTKPVAPEIAVEFNSGDIQKIPIQGVRLDKIKSNLFNLGGTPKIQIQAHENMAEGL